mmetsp:Transcript_442/g.1512  ORF Transcript_442/g.1512 Transcript_442/m.1512 type:complete len:865 (-) Transcript_442:2539-5133(-)
METDEDELRAFVMRCPVLDGHAHSMLASDGNGAEDSPTAHGIPFEASFCEAEWEDAAKVAPNVAACKRGVKDLAVPLGCKPDLKSIGAALKGLSQEERCKLFFSAAGVSGVLIDDGLLPDALRPVWWHEKFTKVKRVLRIETIAEQVLGEMLSSNIAEQQARSPDSLFEVFRVKFRERLDPLPSGVVAFKSIVAYRSGLDIAPEVDEDALSGHFQRWFAEKLGTSKAADGAVRLAFKPLNDYVVVGALDVCVKHQIPMQLHTGFGDRDLDLAKGNPLLLRRLLECQRFKGAKIVLLHASYPYTREAGFLASVYQQIFVDFGLAVPLLSSAGQLAVMGQIFELTPFDKILYSSDGRFFPETYYLASVAARRVLYRILRQMVDEGDLSVDEAVAAAGGVLFENARALHKLDWHPDARLLQNVSGKVHSTADRSHCRPLGENGAEFRFVRLMWVDYSAIRRCRVLPMERYRALRSDSSQSIGLAVACMSMPMMYDVALISPVGEVQLVPDDRAFFPLPAAAGHGLCLVDLYSGDQPWEGCPRTLLKSTLRALRERTGLSVRVGFETEFSLMEGDRTVDSTVYCESAALSPRVTELLDSVADALLSQGIALDQYHAESASGQFELSTAYCDALLGADQLIVTRETVCHAASSKGLKVSMAPKVKANEAGNGCHLHLSLANCTGNREEVTSNAGSKLQATVRHFTAGVLHHLPGLHALTMPSVGSYARACPQSWVGVFKTWGVQNREAPIRVIEGESGHISRFELRCLDATANPHAALSAVILAGMDGISRGLALPEAATVDPALMDPAPERLPSSLEEALSALAADDILTGGLGETFVQIYFTVKRKEVEHFKSLSATEADHLVLQRY